MAAKRILIIDDEADIREVAQISLEMVGGWEVLTAGSGGEGVALARAEGPDAILLDYLMPEMDGPTTIRQLRADPATASIPVLLLTARAVAEQPASVEAIGVAAVITKPFDPMALAGQVARALGWEA
jgi:CheY-like chemotaxis protein